MSARDSGVTRFGRSNFSRPDPVNPNVPRLKSMIAKRTPIQRYASYAIAALLVVASLLGLLYNASSVFAAFAGAFDESQDIGKLPHFLTAFYVMSAICIACYVSIIVASIGICLGSATCARVLAMLLLLEVLYFFAVGSMWTLPNAGRGIAAATGIANGGLMAQFILLMPIWIPIVFAFLGLYRDNPVAATDDTAALTPFPDIGEPSDASERRNRAL
ncbi:hypothetical protein Poly21_57120 [Allorhodopirellula heiligendammensis]|uniref:Uncharacterized protein n=2 Tax=Allorhodopirellula heiligendammensis TaxID=2714739 RepID=A0A5C6AZJ7_9BACT|nr:hypothetical protein Poly21_57120 [Allorhodopirellula heiligendammensis]